jgi:hypothetical protein
VDFSGTWLLVLDEFAVLAHRLRLELASTHQIPMLASFLLLHIEVYS